jgi:hypothetical protein
MIGGPDPGVELSRDSGTRLWFDNQNPNNAELSYRNLI